MASGRIGQKFREFLFLSTCTGAAAVGAGCDQATPTPASTANAAQSATVPEPVLPAPSEAPPASAEPPTPTPVTVSFTAEKPSAFARAAKTTACALDLVGGAAATDVTTVDHESRVRLIGWATDDINSGSIPPVVAIELAGRKSMYAAGARMTKRQDVADVFKIPLLAAAGYDLDATLHDVAPGEYTVNVLQVSAAGNALTCTTKRKFKVQ